MNGLNNLVPGKAFQPARVLNYTTLERIAGCKHLSLFDRILSYEENEVLQIRPLECLYLA
jgi:hypothetical protein